MKRLLVLALLVLLALTACNSKTAEQPGPAANEAAIVTVYASPL